MSAKILVVEDDEVVNELIGQHLLANDYQVTTCHDGATGLKLASEQYFDLILLDIMLPNLNGLEMLRELREIKNTPTLILTALGNEQERIEGLRTGADDYLSKPFNLEELVLRIEAILRRYHQNYVKIADSELFERFTQLVPELTSIELDIVKCLASNVTIPTSKAYLYQSVLHKEFGRYDRTLDMHISNIRKKFKQVDIDPNIIKTVHGKGYMLVDTIQLSGNEP
ncbi:MAG: response regulator transcription factor [Psychrobium sp.]